MGLFKKHAWIRDSSIKSTRKAYRLFFVFFFFHLNVFRFFFLGAQVELYEFTFFFVKFFIFFFSSAAARQRRPEYVSILTNSRSQRIIKAKISGEPTVNWIFISPGRPEAFFFLFFFFYCVRFIISSSGPRVKYLRIFRVGPFDFGRDSAANARTYPNCLTGAPSYRARAS